jgi:hypothetical protein
MIEKRLFQFALEADVNRRGGLDNPAYLMKRMPDELRDVRKITIGRHRVYFHGKHTDCNYHAFYIKSFKKTGVDDEDDRSHQNRLIAAKNKPVTGTLKIAAAPVESSEQDESKE